MTVLLVVGLLVALLTGACVWEARSGRPVWGGPHGRSGSPPNTASAARAGKKQVAATLVIGGLIGLGGGDG